MTNGVKMPWHIIKLPLILYCDICRRLFVVVCGTCACRLYRLLDVVFFKPRRFSSFLILVFLLGILLLFLNFHISHDSKMVSLECLILDHAQIIVCNKTDSSTSDSIPVLR